MIKYINLMFKWINSTTDRTALFCLSVGSCIVATIFLLEVSAFFGLIRFALG